MHPSSKDAGVVFVGGLVVSQDCGTRPTRETE